MEYAPLGRTGLSVSRIGFGCAAMGGADYGRVDDEVSIAAVHRALDLGITFFDVADVYGFGHAEEVLGRALRGVARDVVVATKVGVRWDEQGGTSKDLSEAWIVRALDASLRRLGVQQIALYQIHWPDPRTSIDDAMHVLLRQREAGKIAHIGCCNFQEAQLDQAAAAGPIAGFQIPLGLDEPERRSLAASAASRHGVAVQAYNVLARGLLSGKYEAGHVFDERDTRVRSILFEGEALQRGLRLVSRLKEIAAQVGRTPAQVAARWAAEQAGVAVALTGIKTPEQATENAGAFGWVFDRQMQAYLEAEFV